MAHEYSMFSTIVPQNVGHYCIYQGSSVSEQYICTRFDVLSFSVKLQDSFVGNDLTTPAMISVTKAVLTPRRVFSCLRQFQVKSVVIPLLSYHSLSVNRLQGLTDPKVYFLELEKKTVIYMGHVCLLELMAKRLITVCV